LRGIAKSPPEAQVCDTVNEANGQHFYGFISVESNLIEAAEMELLLTPRIFKVNPSIVISKQLLEFLYARALILEQRKKVEKWRL
jgi:hypothetical protein